MLEKKLMIVVDFEPIVINVKIIVVPEFEVCKILLRFEVRIFKLKMTSFLHMIFTSYL